jgi:hypothetical protein
MMPGVLGGSPNWYWLIEWLPTLVNMMWGGYGEPIPLETDAHRHILSQMAAGRL